MESTKVLYIRHGERDDSTVVGGQHAKSLDPNLTDEGVKQAIKTGKYLKEYLKKHNIERVIVESSPFLRCMKTASHIVKELERDEVKSIVVNNVISELLGSFIF